jgi:ATP-dependent exoDNAse (exonuclease V) alpha subunit
VSNTPSCVDLQPRPIRTGLVEAFARQTNTSYVAEWRALLTQATASAPEPNSPLEWSPQQLIAIDRIIDWYCRGTKQVFFLAGFAGAGKTTLLKEIARRLGVPVAFASFTGKAAAVMAAKGCTGATTIDSLIYRPRIKYHCSASPPCQAPPCDKTRCPYRREEFIGRTLNEKSRFAEIGLVAIDEVSMVNAAMGEDLLSFGKKVLVLGDLAQLPPIEGGGYFISRTPDFELTEIHRQALNSPVIQLATAVRNHQLLQPGLYGDSLVTGLKAMTVSDLLAHDQVIAGTHATRAWINQRMRQKLGFSGDAPQPGERVICEKNNHWRGLHNGTIWTVVEVMPDGQGFLDMTIKNDDGRVVDVVAPIKAFTDTKYAGEYPENPFTFAYVITCHKAQGSQWDSLCVFNESGKWKQDSFR